jgi:LacI family transcriptional regulator
MGSGKQPVTIWDIAAAAGVSVSTVSRVLSGNPHVTEAKRAAVLAAVERFHYRPNVVAQGLARGRSRVLGILAEEIASPFYAPVLSGVAEALRDTEYQPIFAEARLAGEAEARIDMFLERRVDAAIIVGGRAPDELLASVAAQVPLVAVGRSISGLEDHCLQVKNLEGGYEATRHLLGLGHRRIAHITGIISHPDSIDRRAGYQRALEERGIAWDPALVVEGNFAETSGHECLRTLIQRGAGFSAVFVGNDQMAYGAMLALFEVGLSVPEDVSLVGFDDQRGASYTTPPLTTVRQPVVAMGRAAAEAVLLNLAGGPLELPTFNTELIVRQSTRQVRADQTLV